MIQTPIVEGKPENVQEVPELETRLATTIIVTQSGETPGGTRELAGERWKSNGAVQSPCVSHKRLSTQEESNSAEKPTASTNCNQGRHRVDNVG